MAQKQTEWTYQWSHPWSKHLEDTDFLFFDWISPRTIEDFREKAVLDAGCGVGRHVRIVASVAKHVTGVDLNSTNSAKANLQGLENVTILEGDIALYEQDTPFDVVYCIGVIHHTDDPDRTFDNLYKLCNEGGLLILWCYSVEGNQIVRLSVEPVRLLFLRFLPRRVLMGISYLTAALLYLLMRTIYRLPSHFLPYYEHIHNLHTLSFKTQVINVFDKFNAPRTEFVSEDRIRGWFNEERFEDVSISYYMGVSWRASGVCKSSRT
jgi:SAM-dependent methyltransferase